MGQQGEKRGLEWHSYSQERSVLMYLYEEVAEETPVCFILFVCVFSGNKIANPITNSRTHTSNLFSRIQN